ncbi:predicted protein [Nematostella vectensis]|uniref:ADF-H domain-containing protein n=1 Tax=Nematostella vectensis TaxID=45351 RepID=A7S4X7_NEMVE|nr:actin-depolymerizing factor 4 [Nematostella vectensis]EDO41274.1 predicted protein [Nematostella vectensis]|eukprot:XP_001633337.1 predicted protein [Nematostella vectensis]
MAGLNIKGEVTDGWNEIKKAASGLRYIIFKMDEKKENVVFEKKKMKCECSHEDVLDDLPADEPRYIALNLDYKNVEGADRSKLVLIFWCPDNCEIKSRMVSAATFQDVKKKCPGGAKCLEIQERSELSFEALKEELKNVK